MTIVHIHIERTGGVSLQSLYEKKYQGGGMLWYSVRDDLFAPFSIKTANYTKDWQLKIYVILAQRFPIIRNLMLYLRIWRRKRQAVEIEDLHSMATIVIGHFSASKLLPHLSPDLHEYRTVVRDPLMRMWSHYNHFQAHKGDVGQRVVPDYKKMIFEEFAMLPEMRNYQTQATGSDLSIFKHIGTTEKLDVFCKNISLIDGTSMLPWVNHFGGTLPELSSDFIETFRIAHAQDYQFYNLVLEKVSQSVLEPHTLF